VLATGNQGKVREMADLLSDFGFEVLAQSEFNVSEVAETDRKSTHLNSFHRRRSSDLC